MFLWGRIMEFAIIFLDWVFNNFSHGIFFLDFEIAGIFRDFQGPDRSIKSLPHYPTKKKCKQTKPHLPIEQQNSHSPSLLPDNLLDPKNGQEQYDFAIYVSLNVQRFRFLWPRKFSVVILQSPRKLVRLDRIGKMFGLLMALR